MNRRSFAGTIAKGAAIAALVPSTLLITGCATTNLSFYIDTITGSLKALQPLLPGAAALIAKAITIAGDLNAAYKKGDFSSTSAIYANLSDVLNQIAADAGVNNPTVKITLAIAGVALMTIANLLKNQAPVAAVKAARVTASSGALRGAGMIERASTPSNVDAVFQTLKSMQ